MAAHVLADAVAKVLSDDKDVFDVFCASLWTFAVHGGNTMSTVSFFSVDVFRYTLQNYLWDTYAKIDTIENVFGYHFVGWVVAFCCIFTNEHRSFGQAY